MISFFFKAAIVAVALFCGSVVLVSAQDIASSSYTPIAGVITDSKSGEPVEFATITLKGTTLGTVANDKGQFSLEAPRSVGDTLMVGCMGYESFALKIAKSTYGKSITVNLTPTEYAIQEVTLKTKKIKARDVVKMAVARIQQNYFSRPQKSYTFERTISRDSSMHGFLMEGISLRTANAVSFDHRDSQATRRRFIDEINKESSWKDIDTVFDGWGRNIFEDGNVFFKNKQFGKWDFSFVPSPADSLIAISFKQNWRLNEYEFYNGVMFINRNDLAIVRIVYDYLFAHFANCHTTVIYKKQEGQYALLYMLTEDKGYNPFHLVDTGLPFGEYTVRSERYCINVVSSDADFERIIEQITNIKKHPGEWHIPNLPVPNLERN